MPNCEQKYFKYLATNSSISLGIKYTSDLYRPWGALNSSKKTKKYNPRYFWANTSMIVRLGAHKKCTCAYLSMLVPECTLWWIPQRMERMSKRDWLVDLQLVKPSFSRLARWYDQPEKWFIFCIYIQVYPTIFVLYLQCMFKLVSYLFTWVRTFSQVKSCVFKDITSTSVLEWPMLQTIQPFFILSMCSRVTTDLLPVAVTTISTCFTTWDNFTTWRWIEKL